MKQFVVDYYERYLLTTMDYQFPLDMWQDGHVYIEMDFQYDGKGKVTCTCHDPSLSLTVDINLGVTPIWWSDGFELDRMQISEMLAT